MIKALAVALGVSGWLVAPALAEAARMILPGGQEVSFPAGGLVGVGVGVQGPGMVLTLTHVDDQRCPSAFDCYWEGLIRVVIAIKADGLDSTFVTLCNLCEDGDREADVAGYRLTLDHLEPDHAVIELLGRAAVLADYTVVVTVSSAP
jgi:hypothetical protein